MHVKENSITFCKKLTDRQREGSQKRREVRFPFTEPQASKNSVTSCESENKGQLTNE